MNNYFVNMIYIPKYIYLDEIYDYDDILINMQRKSQKNESKKRKRTEEFDHMEC